MKIQSIVLVTLMAALIAGCQSGKKKDHMHTKVKLETSMGNITVLLYDETPKHRDNFIKLAEEGEYDGVLFHRVINNFMVQAGDPTSKEAKKGQRLGSGDVGYTIEAEIDTVYPKRFHKKGVLAAARQGDNVNPQKASSGAQFYIVTGQVYPDSILTASFSDLTPEQIQAYTTVGGTPHLDGNYTVFGEVVEGMDVVDKIQKVKTDRNDRPETDVRIKKVIVE